MVRPGDESESSKDIEGDDGLYNNIHPVVDTKYQVTEQINLLFKIISNTDIAVLDTNLREMNHSIDLTEVINDENGYSLLHLAVFKDSDHIVHSL